ncbi:uncharacterized protein V1477_014665 [Vespula maculifrons]|uniref:Uncharacterized protein n=1 Tax=Vespula maculifrons TaxID=7453 RepID=A0ABD2BI44_VESMC
MQKLMVASGRKIGSIRELGQHERSDDVMFLLAFCRLNCFTYVWEKNNKIRIEDFQYNTSRHRRRKSTSKYENFTTVKEYCKSRIIRIMGVSRMCIWDGFPEYSSCSFAIPWDFFPALSSNNILNKIGRKEKGSSADMKSIGLLLTAVLRQGKSSSKSIEENSIIRKMKISKEIVEFLENIEMKEKQSEYS